MIILITIIITLNDNNYYLFDNILVELLTTMSPLMYRIIYECNIRQYLVIDIYIND